MVIANNTGSVVNIGDDYDLDIACGNIPQGCWKYTTTNLYIENNKYTCPWCFLPITVFHNNFSRCDRDHIVFKSGNIMFIWTRNQDNIRKPDYRIGAEERYRKEEEFGRSRLFVGLSQYIQITSPRYCIINKPSLLSRFKYALLDTFK